MNRKDRRAAEAKTRKSYQDYAALCRKALPGIDDRWIGEGFMRGAQVEATGFHGAMVHAPNTPRPALGDCDVQLVASYGPLSFRCVVRASDLPLLRAHWLEVTQRYAETDPAARGIPLQEAAQSDICATVVANLQYGHASPLIAGALAWLAWHQAPDKFIARSSTSSTATFVKPLSP